MPRVTRAQLRVQEAEGGPQIIHKDVEVSPTTVTDDYDPFSTEVSTRPPLGEIDNTNTPLPEPERTEPLAPTKQTKGVKKSKGSEKESLHLVLENNENLVPNTEQEILEDENQSDASSAAEMAAQALMKDSPEPKMFKTPVDTVRTRTSLSTAARAATRSLSRSPEKKLIALHGSAVKTPRFDPAVHAETPSAGQAAKQTGEDSFVGSIKSRTPARMMTLDGLAGDGSDSFVEDITSRSPSKYVARIEDSVEALDALEEAIEQVAEELPKAMAEGLESPVNTRTPRATTAKPSQEQSVSHSAVSARQAPKNSSSATRSTSTTTTSATTKAVPPKSAPRVSSARPQPRPSTLTSAKPRSSTQLTSSAVTAKRTQPAPTTTRSNKRISSTNLSTSKPGFVPTKSAKAPTKSNFSLPGDAISAKLKARREEQRLKKEEAEANATRKRTEFKARPVPKVLAAAAAGKGRISSVLPRETAASRARMSLMALRKEEEGKENAGRTAKKGVAASRLGTVRLGSDARKSGLPSTAQVGLSVSKTRSSPPTATAAAATEAKKKTVPANTSAARKNTTTYPAPSKVRQSSTQTTTASGVRSGSDGSSDTNAAAGTSKGKEVFGRGKIAEQNLVKQKWEKKEAAKKARAEAAERGRLASREWAEKQKKRKTMVMTAAEEVKVGKSMVGEVGTADIGVTGCGYALPGDVQIVV